MKVKTNVRAGSDGVNDVMSVMTCLPGEELACVQRL